MRPPADNRRFGASGGWSDNPNCGGYENRRWQSKLRTVESPTSQSGQPVARKRATVQRDN